MNEPLLLPRHCGNCQHWDGDVHCALPPSHGARLISMILEPELVVCAKHEPKREDEA